MRNRETSLIVATLAALSVLLTAACDEKTPNSSETVTYGPGGAATRSYGNPSPPNANSDSPSSTTANGELAPYIIGDAIGCSDRTHLERLVRFKVEDDEIAFKKLFASLISSGACQILRPGTKVFIEDTAIFSGLISIRLAGDVEPLWTSFEKVKLKRQ